MQRVVNTFLKVWGKYRQPLVTCSASGRGAGTLTLADSRSNPARPSVLVIARRFGCFEAAHALT